MAHPKFRNYNAKDVDAYISGSTKEARLKLQEIRDVIKSAIPKAEESISWGVPFYKYFGLLAGFTAFKNHISFGFCDVLTNEDRSTLEKKGYTTGKKTIQIKFDQKVPSAVIKRIIKVKAKSNQMKKA